MDKKITTSLPSMWSSRKTNYFLNLSINHDKWYNLEKSRVQAAILPNLNSFVVK